MGAFRSGFCGCIGVFVAINVLVLATVIFYTIIGAK